MIEPVRKDHAFLHDVAEASRVRDTLHLWWLGQSGFLLQWNDAHLLFDPYLSDSLTRKYANTDRPHVRMTERVVDPAELDFITAITSSHNHSDHLDAETLRALMKVNDEVQLIVPEANRAFAAERLGCDLDWPIGLDDGDAYTVGPFELIAVPAAHETIERDEQGRLRFLGYVLHVGPWTVYHSGDTVLYDGMANRLQLFDVDVAMLPINGRAPARGVSGNLNGAEAAQLAHDIGAQVVIPCHYEMFEFNTESPDAFEAACRALHQQHATLRAGERWSTAGLSPR